MACRLPKVLLSALLVSTKPTGRRRASSTNMPHSAPLSATVQRTIAADVTVSRIATTRSCSEGFNCNGMPKVNPPGELMTTSDNIAFLLLCPVDAAAAARDAPANIVGISAESSSVFAGGGCPAACGLGFTVGGRFRGGGTGLVLAAGWPPLAGGTGLDLAPPPLSAEDAEDRNLKSLPSTTVKPAQQSIVTATVPIIPRRIPGGGSSNRRRNRATWWAKVPALSLSCIITPRDAAKVVWASAPPLALTLRVGVENGGDEMLSLVKATGSGA
eukprot:CAMPEP_0178424982 /NCGR_PEP_ID=MMETSP0689_2-20121128/28490_1 /TAXON_ID=160604 /ORGANISM="Amphidinium massartii, Strain CS-259" /LENGTH=271 /DNA_ID=CAMNT_0020046635 /DNA_START=406 /DNA_END=1221 /DNA_ORIENTATION=+